MICLGFRALDLEFNFMSLVKCQNISKIYHLEGVDVPALQSVSLSIEEGNFVSIVGPSGSGKSTLMHILGLLDKPTSGNILFENQDVSDLNQNEQAEIRSKKIGFIFQSFNLLARTSSIDNVIVPMLYSSNRKDMVGRATSILEKVGLGDRLKNTPGQLSGGQQQRVAIARALINDPKIIFADEPTGNLDSKSGQEIMTMLHELNSEGKTIIVVTHDSDIANQAHHKIVMKDGKII